MNQVFWLDTCSLWVEKEKEKEKFIGQWLRETGRNFKEGVW
jgi:hypothetical protein